MSSALKKGIAIIGCLLLVFVAYYGTYLPLQKSRSFIRTVRSMSGARSVGEFKALFDIPLQIPSPIGQEELVRNMTSEIASFIGRGASNTGVEEELAAFAENYFTPIIARGKGMSFEQDLYIIGSLKKILYERTQKSEYLDAAEKYFLEGRQLGPKRPQFLYSLLDVYLLKKDIARVKILADQIHAQWPADSRITNLLGAIKETTTTASTSVKSGKK